LFKKFCKKKLRIRIKKNKIKMTMQTYCRCRSMRAKKKFLGSFLFTYVKKRKKRTEGRERTERFKEGQEN